MPSGPTAHTFEIDLAIKLTVSLAHTLSELRWALAHGRPSAEKAKLSICGSLPSGILPARQGGLPAPVASWWRRVRRGAHPQF